MSEPRILTPITDVTDWEVLDGSSSGRVFVESETIAQTKPFYDDAWLEVTGNMLHDEKVAYATYVAAKLNAPAPLVVPALPRIDLARIRALKAELRAINEIDLVNLEVYDNGVPVKVNLELCANQQEIGLSTYYMLCHVMGDGPESVVMSVYDPKVG